MRTVYVFFIQRPQDKQTWPVVYENRELAEDAPHRVSEIVEVQCPSRAGTS